jgi:hypothetical protein
MPRIASRHSAADGKVLSFAQVVIGELMLPWGKFSVGSGDTTYHTTGSGGGVAQAAVIIRNAKSVARRPMGALSTEAQPASRIDAREVLAYPAQFLIPFSLSRSDRSV